MTPRIQLTIMSTLIMTVGVGLISGGLFTASPLLVGIGLGLFVVGAVVDNSPLTPRHP